MFLCSPVTKRSLSLKIIFLGKSTIKVGCLPLYASSVTTEKSRRVSELKTALPAQML